MHHHHLCIKRVKVGISVRTPGESTSPLAACVMVSQLMNIFLSREVPVFVALSWLVCFTFSLNPSVVDNTSEATTTT